MFGSEHPSYEDLLLLESGELGVDRAKPVEYHLVGCSDCQAQYASIRSVRSAVASSRPPLAQARRPLAPRLRAITAAVAAVAVAVYFLTGGTPAARADELLQRAAAQQANEKKTAARLRLTSSGKECYAAADGPTLTSGGDDGNFCNVVAAVLRSAGWEGPELLSAQKFQSWRDSLQQKDDTVTESDQTTEIKTVTSEGVLRSASIHLINSDFRAVAARYEFVGDANQATAFEVREAPQVPARTAANTAPRLPDEAPPAPRRAPGIDPMTRREARVRLALHDAGADGDLRLAVQPEPNTIRVWGVVHDDRARQAIAAGLAGLSGVETAIATEAEVYASSDDALVPWTAFQGNTLPLAHDLLDRLFHNDPQGRQSLLNDLDDATRQLAGAAKSREALRELAAKVPASPLRTRLNKAADDFDRVIAELLAQIARRLEPVSGPLTPGPSRQLTEAEGMDLYTLVHQTVFLGVSSDDTTLSEALSRIAERVQPR